MPNEEKNVFQDVALEHSGTKITLPSIPRPMTTQEAREALYEIEQDLETEVMLNHEIECFPLDGAVAFARALLKRYGHPIGTKTPPKHMFDSAKPPTLVTVPISATEKDLELECNYCLQKLSCYLEVECIRWRWPRQGCAVEAARPCSGLQIQVGCVGPPAEQ